jgi:flagellin FlaB
MKSITKNDNAFTGLEAAIVLIAFVVVAAVFSYVVLGAGFFTTQKSQETVYSGVAQATSNIQMIGQVYGLTSSATSVGAVQEIRFSIGLAPGSPTLDLSLMKLAFSTPGTDPKIYTYDSATTPTGLKFASLQDGVTQTDSLTAQKQVQISFKTPEGIAKNTQMNMEIRPSVGASLPFTKTTPPALTYMNVLY